jgi:heme-degrading monooxygenase HmoA
MIERHVTFYIHEGQNEAFARYFRERYKTAMAETPGFVSASLLGSQEAPSQLMMVLRFQDADSALAWRRSENHEMLKPQLKSMYEKSELQVFDVLI